jgi:hypothetical protein
LNFITGRKAPTRFVYQYPLFTKSYRQSQLTWEFLNDLIENPPEIIIDGWKDTDKVPPLNQIDRSNWSNPWLPYYDTPPEMSEVFRFINENYYPSIEIGPEKWVMYRYKK